ncbi:MAG: hypothetical protein ACP5I8_01640 [Phycisphaerae bacterium]
MRPIPEDTLLAIQQHFHAVIRERAGNLVDEHRVELPDLRPLLTSDEPKAWFPVSGMYGGFSYWLEGEGDDAKLITESWCRVVGGSGQRHEITGQGSRLIAEGFV